MRLKRLELLGFKSFADRTVMDFGTHRLTGIVGPNGCGKSNVVDAVRWVLGETRPTSLRGAGMTDVIFKGSASRPPMSVAEVTMVLDNESGAIPERAAEVGITRRLYRDGEGEYLIDGEKVRLKDVRDMLFDTGLGSRGYSVLEQGKIDAVLSANPRDRRSIFEEAAGISRYRQRRHEAQLRLKRVEQDVARLEDLLGELRTRSRSLKIQAGKAERWLELRAEYLAERRRSYQHRWLALDAELAQLAPLLESLEAEVGRLRERRGACEGEALEQEEARARIASELDGATAEVGALAGELRALEERRAQLALRVASWRTSAREEAERATSLSAAVADRRGELDALGERGTELARELASAEETAGGLTGRSRELDKSYRELRKAVQAQNDAVLARLGERTAAHNALRHLEGAANPSGARLERVRARLAELDETLRTARAQSEQAALEAEAARAQRARAEEQARARRDELGTLEGELERARAERAQRGMERAALGARVEALLDREAERAGLSEGTRAVIEAVERGDGPCGPEDLLGILADHVRIDVRLARALDAALGERAQCLVARDAHVALDVLAWLERERRGLVSVVVPRGVGAPDCPSPGDFAMFARYGNAVEGRLCELVRCDASLRPLVRALLCDVVVVGDLEVALDLVGREPGWRFVTPRGELVDAAGVVGGHREVTQGAVGRRSSAAELAQRGERADRELAELDARLAGLALQCQEQAARLAAASQERDAAVREEGERAARCATAAARLADHELARGEHAREESQARAEIARLEVELAAAGRAAEEAEESFRTENARLEEVEHRRRELEEERDALAREESRAKVESTRLAAELAALRHRLEEGERRDVEERAEIARAQGRSRNFTANAEQGVAEGETIAASERALGAERAAGEARLEVLRGEERACAEAARVVRARAEETQRSLDAAGERLSEQKLERQRRELAREELLGRAREELALAPEELCAGFEPDPALAEPEALAALEARVAELKSALDRIGPVNTEAVHELAEVQGRLDFLEGQARDLADSKKNLADTIDRIDGESRRLFLETFEEVQRNFQRIFRQLFGGGRADIRLEEGVDVLEAGIDIVARPPGREMLSIGLLSGGQRTMTALALLFAVFEARPSPFCILDEVDAALDDANIDRFLGMLDGFLASTQFVVVTHNKGSMAACDALYGVTMQVKGVSRYVAVQLEEALTYGESSAEVRSRAARAIAAADGADGVDGDLDRESGERVVEIVPARAASDDVGVELGVEVAATRRGGAAGP